MCCFVVVCVLGILGGGWRLGGWGGGGVSRRGLLGDCVVGISALRCSASRRMGWKGFIVRIPRWSLSFGIDCVLGRDVVE